MQLGVRDRHGGKQDVAEGRRDHTDTAGDGNDGAPVHHVVAQLYEQALEQGHHDEDDRGGTHKAPHDQYDDDDQQHDHPGAHRFGHRRQAGDHLVGDLGIGEHPGEQPRAAHDPEHGGGSLAGLAQNFDHVADLILPVDEHAHDEGVDHGHHGGLGGGGDAAEHGAQDNDGGDDGGNGVHDDPQDLPAGQPVPGLDVLEALQLVEAVGLGQALVAVPAAAPQGHQHQSGADDQAGG